MQIDLLEDERGAVQRTAVRAELGHEDGPQALSPGGLLVPDEGRLRCGRPLDVRAAAQAPLPLLPRRALPPRLLAPRPSPTA